MSDPRITDEVVELAAQAYNEAIETDAFGDVGDDQRFDAMQAALEAARPHLAPQPVLDREALLDRDAIRSLLQEWRVGPARPDATLSERTNYRRKLTNALLELARPMPTQEQIEQRIRRLYIDGGAHITHAQEAAKDVTDAVLALLNGGAK